jgi:hypothetical protein
MVVMAKEECIVMKDPSHLAVARRKRVLNAARDLARSGRYSGHASILVELEPMEGFAESQDRLQVIRSQLDHLCALAQAGRLRIHIPGR